MAVLSNAKHEKFAHGVANGMSQRKAYRAAFPSSLKWKDETVDSKASALANSDKVLARITELKEQASSEAVKTAIQRKEWLSSVIDDDSIDINAKLKACDLLNKMDGEYVTKVEGSITTKLEDLL